MSTRREFFAQAAALMATVTSSHAVEAPVADGATNARTSMKTYKVPHTDLIVSRIAYGSAMLGSDQHGADFIARTLQAMQTAYDQGVTLFDLADIYGAGKSETALGAWLKQSPGLRAKVVIQSKCGGSLPEGWVPGDPVSAQTFSMDLSREHIVSAAEGSLGRLGTDYLDILLLHAFDPLVEPHEVAQAFEELHRSGKVRYFGVSNHNGVQIEILKKYISRPLVANQIALGLGRYLPIAPDHASCGFGGIVDYCRLHDIQVQAYSPLRAVSDRETGLSLLNPSADSPAAVKELARLLVELAKQKSSTPSAVMLAWLLRHPVGIVPVIGAGSPQHVIENCAADRVELSRHEWHTLFNAAAALQPRQQT